MYNEGLRWLSNVRIRVEVLDTDGTAVEEAFGWVFGDLTPVVADTSSFRSTEWGRPTE